MSPTINAVTLGVADLARSKQFYTTTSGRWCRRPDGDMRIAVTGSTGALGGQVLRLLAAGNEHGVLSVKPADRAGAGGANPDGR